MNASEQIDLQPVDAALALEVADLLEEYANVIDEDRLEAWPELFVPQALYRVLSRENAELGLPAPLMYYYSQGMLRDRVTALRDALTYEFVYTRHVTSPARVRQRLDGDLEARSNFTIYQTTEEGVTRTFAVGGYRDVITRTEAGLRFRERTAILDTFGVPNNIAVPL